MMIYLPSLRLFADYLPAGSTSGLLFPVVRASWCVAVTPAHCQLSPHSP